ncbi:hypothetical protein [Actibacterium mucosum]|uniref:hypothetical protein n=1 Tax=Actibacterium mucosum TaxID=1087332 RepID=UPI001F3D021E|nr:hypothetical protein [Actibacterium mucosum]
MDVVLRQAVFPQRTQAFLRPGALRRFEPSEEISAIHQKSGWDVASVLGPCYTAAMKQMNYQYTYYI